MHLYVCMYTYVYCKSITVLQYVTLDHKTSHKGQFIKNKF